MLRAYVYSSVAMSLFSFVVLARADDAKSTIDKDNHEATIVKLDSQKDTIEVRMKGPDGKEVEKTLQFTDKPEYLDSKGKTTKMDAFHAGDHVRITEKDGKVSELKLQHAHARITKVDAKNGTITVTMKDENGKDVEKTFRLMEDTEYVDSTGLVARIDTFRSGDEVLVVENEGQIKELKKDSKQNDTGDKDSKSVNKTSSNN